MIMTDEKDTTTPEQTDSEVQARSFIFGAVKSLTSIPLIIEVLITLLGLLLSYLKKEKQPKPK
jgi:hypothetical protein